MLTTLMHCWHGQANEGIVDCWHHLYVGGKDLSVLSQVEDKGVTGPSAFYFHNIEGDTPQQVLEGRAEVFTLPLLFQADSVGLRVSRIHIFLLFHHCIFLMIFQSWSEHFWVDLSVQRTFPMDCQWTDNKPATKMTRTDGIPTDIANGILMDTTNRSLMDCEQALVISIISEKEHK